MTCSVEMTFSVEISTEKGFDIHLLIVHIYGLVAGLLIFDTINHACTHRSLIDWRQDAIMVVRVLY